MPGRGDDAVAPLRGLVLAGGWGRRMGRDKGLLEYGGTLAVRRSWSVLDSVGIDTVVSVRADQQVAYRDLELPLLVDTSTARGPAAGLLTAWARHASCAWLALAVDMPFVDRALLTDLIRARNAARIGTAFRHADGVIEPLCTIWEPTAHPFLAARAAMGRFSLREILEAHGVETVKSVEVARLESVNTPERYARLRQSLSPALRTR